MKILHYLFNIISPDKSRNWLSMRFHRWEYDRKKRKALLQRKWRSDSVAYFSVVGAGDICMSKATSIQCGGVQGFHFGVEWSDSPFIGGVLGKEEAVKMAEFILSQTAQ